MTIIGPRSAKTNLRVNAGNRKKTHKTEILSSLRGKFFKIFNLFFQEDEEYLVAWRVSQVQETLEKPGYHPSLGESTT